uniref:Endonuclease/exonuclease/phosphatase domain-containing protein n=1 Tax=Aegilops tauschii subsp. strangulata TaxID=200361 RepID=A0A453IJP9_AEGTS
MSVLDRVFVDPEWELKFPLASLRAITRVGSDHVPLLLSTENDRPHLLLASISSPFGSTRLGLPTLSMPAGWPRVTPLSAPSPLLTPGSSVLSSLGSL